MNPAALARILGKLVGGDQAATATEYAVMLALVLAVIVATVTLFGQTLGAEYGRIDGTLFG